MPFLLCDPVSLTRVMCIHMEIYLVGERRQLKSGSNAKENESLYQEPISPSGSSGSGGVYKAPPPTVTEF